ncbi:unnamed protein product [Phytophthora lilii]|uniref:RxLR effector protein n=1 Tax=Phytophthora lilii TaxID=2077276 RepID=A0A9W6XCE0_9STRA|nr:unnamed protein product [Phytophthora lilii]
MRHGFFLALLAVTFIACCAEVVSAKAAAQVANSGIESNRAVDHALRNLKGSTKITEDDDSDAANEERGAFSSFKSLFTKSKDITTGLSSKETKLLARIKNIADKGENVAKVLPKESAEILKQLGTKESDLLKAIREVPATKQGFRLFWKSRNKEEKAGFIILGLGLGFLTIAAGVIAFTPTRVTN